MKKLFILRGIMGSGKSTFITNNNLDIFTLSTDKIRMMIQSPILTEDGGLTISNANDDKVFKFLLDSLEDRMKRGELIFIDAVHATKGSIDRYKNLVTKYRYRAYVIDFSDIPYEKALEQNKQRECYKVIPEKSIKTAYANILKNEIPSFVEVINHDEAMDIINLKPLDFSNYKKVHHIGDIHGCFTVLKNYIISEYFNKDDIDYKNIIGLYDEKHKFIKAYINTEEAAIDLNIEKSNILKAINENNLVNGYIFEKEENINIANLLNEDNMYIFTGDYIDRGIENEKVMKFLFRIMGKSNVLFIQGNHECWLNYYANNENALSPEFVNNTKKQLENLDKKDIRRFYRKLIDIVYYKYNEKTLLVNHGGLPIMPLNLTKISSQEFIKGVGDYDFNVDKAFSEKVTNKNIYQIHGHRNYKKQEFNKYSNSFSLENEIEFGGNLRVLILDNSGFSFKEFKNDVYKLPDHLKVIENVENMVEVLVNNENIKEKRFGNISSFNFTRDVFYSKKWNNINNKARGLFINTSLNKIIARGYEKFFNIGEVHETTLESLQNNLRFPMKGYLKENGYFGLIGYDEEIDDLIFCSKSAINSDFSLWFKNIFNDNFNVKNYSELKHDLKTNNVCLCFEVIDIVNDPHIIKHNKSKIVLLDVIYRNPVFEKFNYLQLKEFANKYNFEFKKELLSFHNYEEFETFYKNILINDFKYNNEYIEGFVFEDINNFMFKVKLPYYLKWKYIRNLKEKGKESILLLLNNKIATSDLNKDVVDFLKWIVNLSDIEYNKDIIYLRDLYLKNKKD